MKLRNFNIKPYLTAWAFVFGLWNIDRAITAASAAGTIGNPDFVYIAKSLLLLACAVWLIAVGIKLLKNYLNEKENPNATE